MRLQNRIGRMFERRNRRVRNCRPSMETIEARVLLATGFVQGFVLNNVNAPLVGATVQLENTSDHSISTTSTDSTGYYAFNGVAPGVYDVTETATGFATNGVNIQTTINPASAINSNTGIQVTVEDLSTLPEISTQYTANAVTNLSDGNYFLQASSYNAAGDNHLTDPNLIGGFELTLSGPAGTTVSEITSYCSDLTQDIGPPPVTFFAQPSLTPSSTTQPGLATNIGELAYLYNTYGQFINPLPDPSNNGFGDSINSAGLQLALWALEYNANPVTSLSSPNSPFEVDTTATAAEIVSSANSYLAVAMGKSQDVYFLNGVGSTGGGDQGMLSTDLLSFTNKLAVQPTLTTVASATAGGVVGTADLSDAATLSGGDSPTGTISFSLTAPDGTTTPEGSVTVTGDGVYDSPTSVLATEVGTYTWHAMYSGDTNNNPATDNGANEGVTIVQASPALVSVASATAGGVVGTAELSDAATLSGGDSPTGTISFSLTAPDGTTTPEGSVTVTGDGVYDSPTSVLATEVGTYTWHAMYSGDTNNNPAIENGANEGVTIVTGLAGTRFSGVGDGRRRGRNGGVE